MRLAAVLIQRGVALVMAAGMLVTTSPATEHIVPRTKLQAELTNSQAATRADRAELIRFLSTPQAQKVIRSAGVEFHQVKRAVATLDNETAAELAERAREVNRDFAAGALSNQSLTYIVIALATAVVVLIAVD